MTSNSRRFLTTTNHSSTFSYDACAIIDSFPPLPNALLELTFSGFTIGRFLAFAFLSSPWAVWMGGLSLMWCSAIGVISAASSQLRHYFPWSESNISYDVLLTNRPSRCESRTSRTAFVGSQHLMFVLFLSSASRFRDAFETLLTIFVNPTALPSDPRRQYVASSSIFILFFWSTTRLMTARNSRYVYHPCLHLRGSPICYFPSVFVEVVGYSIDVSNLRNDSRVAEPVVDRNKDCFL